MATTALGGTPCQTVGELPAVGSTAPAFTLTGADFSEVTLPAGTRVVLNIFPSVETGVCSASVRRFTELADSPEWIDRLKIVGIDLRDPTQVIALAEDVAAAGPLDILINNAAQTVRRSPAAYRELVAAESAPPPAGQLPAAEVIGSFGSGAVAALPAPRTGGLSARDVTELALVSGSAAPARIAAVTISCMR